MGLKKLSYEECPKRRTRDIYPISLAQLVRNNKTVFVNQLAAKLYANEDHEPIHFEDGSVITEDMLIKILDYLTET